MIFAACSDDDEPRVPVVGSGDAGVLYAAASVQLAQIRPRWLIDLNLADPKDLTAQTAWWPIQGQATFRTIPDGVDFGLELSQCRVPYSYPVRIYDAGDCSTLERGAEPREKLDDLFCFGSAGGTVFTSRANSANKPWSLGGHSATNLIGRMLAVLDPDTGEPLLCAPIEVAEGGKPVGLSTATPPRPEVVAALGNLCVFRALPEWQRSTPCPDPVELNTCVLEHCVGACLERCSDHIACLDAASDPCEVDCQPETDCRACLGPQQCALGFCAKHLACAPPVTPEGPCTELRECCVHQGPLAETCAKFVTSIEGLGGDATCLGTLFDWDFNTNFAYRHPCYPDGGVPEL